MHLTLLLADSTTHTLTVTTGSLAAVYIALSGTITASILAAFASRRASLLAYKTAHEVATLSTQTSQATASLAAQTAREIAELSAKVSRESAKLAAQTAHDIKAQDYRDDFYKRIIAKRLDAWEEVERFLAQIDNPVVDREDKQSFYEYCANGEVFDSLLDKIRGEMRSRLFWMGKDYMRQLIVF